MSIEAKILHNMFGELCLDRFNAALALARSQAVEADIRGQLKAAEEKCAALCEADREDRGAPQPAAVDRAPTRRPRK